MTPVTTQMTFIVRAGSWTGIYAHNDWDGVVTHLSHGSGFRRPGVKALPSQSGRGPKNGNPEFRKIFLSGREKCTKRKFPLS